MLFRILKFFFLFGETKHKSVVCVSLQSTEQEAVSREERNPRGGGHGGGGAEALKTVWKSSRTHARE